MPTAPQQQQQQQRRMHSPRLTERRNVVRHSASNLVTEWQLAIMQAWSPRCRHASYQAHHCEGASEGGGMAGCLQVQTGQRLQSQAITNTSLPLDALSLSLAHRICTYLGCSSSQRRQQQPHRQYPAVLPVIHEWRIIIVAAMTASKQASPIHQLHQHARSVLSPLARDHTP